MKKFDLGQSIALLANICVIAALSVVGMQVQQAVRKRLAHSRLADDLGRINEAIPLVERIQAYMRKSVVFEYRRNAGCRTQ